MSVSVKVSEREIITMKIHMNHKMPQILEHIEFLFELCDFVKWRTE